MKTLDITDKQHRNRNNYDDLIVSIEAGQYNLNLLLAVCDDQRYRSRLIKDYEKELDAEGIRPYRLTINPKDPSLYDTLSRQVSSDEYLQQRNKAVLTVTGAEKLFFLKLGEERSQRDIFIGYLQYTREGLRHFPFPVVLWLTNAIHDQIAQQAVDFYSWRKGVFFFVPESIAIVETNYPQIARELSFSDIEQNGVGMLEIDDLKELIASKQGEHDASLATLYASLGNAYKQRVDSGKSIDYQADLAAAITAWEKVVELKQSFTPDTEFANSLNNLAYLYESQGRYEDAEPLYLQALDLSKRLLGENHPDVATSLNNLALLYKSQGRYNEAEPLFLQALELRKRLLGENHPDVATFLNNLALLYKSQGRYDEAEPLFLQALELRKRLLGENHPDVATSLNNLAGLYESQGRYDEAEPLYLRALELRKRLLGENHPDVATSLNNLALLYNSQSNYPKAEALSKQALTIYQQTLGNQHPNTQNALLTVRMFPLQILLHCDTETLLSILQALAQQAEIPDFNTEGMFAMLELLESNPELLSEVRKFLQQGRDNS